METSRESQAGSGLPQEAESVLPAQAQANRPWVLWLLANFRWLWPILVVTAVVAASWSDLHSVHFRQLRFALHTQNTFWLGIAALLTLANLAVMGLYDVVSLRGSHVRVRERWWIGVLAFAWSNFLTLGPLAGPAIRFWLYRPAGLSFSLLRQAIVSISAAFGTALLVWLAAGLLPVSQSGIASLAIRTSFAFLLAFLCGILARKVQLWRRFPNWVRELKVKWPLLFALGVVDWFLAFLVFASIIRSGAVELASGAVLHLFFFGQGIGLLSLIPGGLGSADAFWLARLDSYVGKAAAALVTYRVFYYLLPWCAATLLLLRRAVHAKVRWAGPARLMVSLLVVLSGCIVLISAATPALAHRLRLLEQILPIAVLETSHLASALVGLLLLVLARGLMKGYRSAYRTTLALLLTGAVFNLLKGLDYEEAILLALTASLLWTHSQLFTLPNRPGGTAIAVLTPIAVAVFVYAAAGFTAYSGHTYSHSLWLTVAHQAAHARFLRSLSVLLLMGLLVAIYIIQRIPHSYTPPSDPEVRRALEIHDQIGKGTNALMVLNGDKLIHFWEDRAFCLYRTIGSYMFVFSDPIAPSGAERQFVGSLLQKASELDRSLAFYQISAAWIPVLHDFGYSFFKLGEEAIVDMSSFNIQGNKGKAMRNVLNKFRNDGYTFEVISKTEVLLHLAELRMVSEEWLRSKRAREKQFSIGFFDEGYLCSFPCALVRDKSERVVAFSNILLGPEKAEFSVDLMRYLPECPNGVMDLLFLKLFEWGKEQGYRTFNMGMAPLATVGDVRQARLQERLANILFQHGEHWYNFRGLRQFKEKFGPRWSPRYMAYPAFWRWPQALANVAALISGGWRNVLFPVSAGALGAQREYSRPS